MSGEPTTTKGGAARGSLATPLRDDITWWMHGLAGLSRVGLAGLTRIKLEGALDSIPKEGPIILAANHASNLDPLVMAAVVLPKVGRRFQWLGKKELFAWPVGGWVARNGGVHPVDRATADVEAFRLARRILDEGHILFVFPEGTRSADGRLQEARDGTSVLALRTDAPILPVGIAGSHGEALRDLLGRVALLRLERPVLTRALEPFPVPVRTLDALHLASMGFLLEQGQSVALATYDSGMEQAALALGWEVESCA